MPLTRYQIRDEYSLADPELYKAADKDDPEALLEGVAMAGLVGVLRQLGDLAEFAAEIFHDLHEEVMATAARGHSLTIRVQQLEADFPSIEKAFLSQTSHSSLFYSPGAEWHPNMRMDQNLISQGDMPRFVMDSYEESRGPPRLFLLDKFDVAGAGACLKRYTDPSFFKVDSSSLKITNAELHREKKIRKAKKKASRWRNRETPEVQPTSHAKLHQLFLEESVENHINNPSCRVKLKRRLNEFPFDPKTKGSYMGKFLASLTPNHVVDRDIIIDSKPMKLPSHFTGNSGIKINDISTVASDEELLQIMGKSCSSSDAEDNGRELSTKELKEDVHYEFVEASKLNCISESNDRMSKHHDEVKEKEVEVDAQSKLVDSFDGYPSDADDIASEVENYMDALTTMDSEIETDNELRAKKRAHSLISGNQGIDSDENENNSQRRSSESTSESTSLGSSTGSDEINSAPKNDYPQSNSSHDLIEDTLFCGDVSGKTPPNEPCNTQIDNVPSDPVYEESQFAENGVCNEDDTRRHGSESGNTSCGGSLTDSTPVTLPVDSGKPFSEDASAGPELEEISSEFKELGADCANVVEGKIDAGDCVACESDHSNSTSQSIDGFLHEVSSENQSVNDSDDEVPPILDNASLLPSNISDLAPEEGTESLSGDVLLVEEHEEEQAALVSPTNSLHSVSLQTEEKQNRSSALQETCLPDKGPNGGGPEVDDSSQLPSDMAVSSSSVVSPKAVDLASLESNENPEDVVPCDSALEIPYCGGENLGGASSASDEVGRFFLDRDCEVKGDADLQFSSDLQESPDSPSLPNVHQENVTTNTVDPEVTAASAVSRNHSSVTEETEEDSASGSPQLLDDSVSSLQDSCQRGVEISNTSSPDHLQESLLLKEAHQQPTFSELDFALDNAGCSDGNIDQRSLSPSHPEFVEECSSTVQDVLVSGSEIDEESLPMNIREPLVPEVVDQPEVTPSNSDNALCNSPESPNGIPRTFEIEPPSNQQHQDSELNSFQPVIVDKNAEDAVSSPSDHIISELKLPSEETVELQDDQFDTGSRQELEFSEYESTQQMNATDSNTELRISSEELVELSDAQLDVELWHEQKVSESESTQHMDVAGGKEDTVTSPTTCAPEPRFPSELKELEEQEFHVISRPDDNLNSEPIHLEEKVQSPSYFSKERSIDVSSESSVACLSTKPMVLEHFDSKEQVENTSISVDTFSLFPEVSHIELDEMPPLPPLPPMQWRMGKGQNASLPLTAHNLSSIRHEQVQVGHLQVHPNLALFSENETLQHSHDNVLGSIVHASPSAQVPNTINHKNSDNGFPSFGESQLSNQLFLRSTVDNQNSGSGYLVSGGEETAKHNENGEDVAPTHTPGSLQEKPPQPGDQVLDRESSEAEKPQEIIIISEGIGINRPDATYLPIAVEDQTQHSLSTTEGQHVWSLSMSYPLPSNGDGNKPMRLPRPRSPLIDAVAAHDKSKLRKVTERVRPRSEQEVDERDSLLEQIRAKSFNLKPAVVTRPSIQGPKTNLRVAAILEKANAIRQAFAGSDDDEDDEDSWSDS